MSFDNAINSIVSNQDAFGNLATTSVNPRIQLQFPYTLNSELIKTQVTGSGTVTHSTPFAVCSTAAAINSSATLSTKNNLHYRSDTLTISAASSVAPVVASTGISWSEQF